jgi:hypothetical protein
MPFPKWGGLPEVTGKLMADGLKPLSVVSSTAEDALNNGVDDGFTEKHLKFIKDTSLLMKGTFKGIDNCLNASIAAANSRIYEDLNDDFYKDHGKTVEKAEEESNEALRKIQALIPKEDNHPVDAPDDAVTTVFPAWVQPEDGKTTWWQSDGNSAADDMTTVFPAVR